MSFSTRERRRPAGVISSLPRNGQIKGDAAGTAALPGRKSVIPPLLTSEFLILQYTGQRIDKKVKPILAEGGPHANALLADCGLMCSSFCRHARKSMVLLKNEGNLLPLDKAKIKSIAVIGPDAYPAVPLSGGSARVEPFAAISFMEGSSQQIELHDKIVVAALNIRVQ